MISQRRRFLLSGWMLLTIFLVSSVAIFEIQSGQSIARKAPHVVIVVGTNHYEPNLSMPLFAKELQRLGFKTTLVMGEGDPEKKTEGALPGIEAIETADVAILYMRFLQLSDEEWKPIESYIESGKPIIALRTTSHSFKYDKAHPRHGWNDGFGRRVMGTPYIFHMEGNTDVSVVDKNKTHPILQNLQKSNWTSDGKLYLTRLEPGCIPLMTGIGSAKPRLLEKSIGTIAVNETETDVVAWTWTNEWGARVFGTSYGHPYDFAEPSFTRMLVNSVYWAVDKPVPDSDVEISTWAIERPAKYQKKQ